MQPDPALLDSLPDAIVIVDAGGGITTVNSQAEAMFGYTRAELVGQALEVLLPERDRAAHVSRRAAYFEHPRPRPMGAGLRLHGRRSTGEEFPVEISLSPLDTAHGRLAMSAIRDISDRRRVELALQQKNIELESANRAKDRFLATMSHELRTPLNAVIGFTGLLQMKLAGPLTADQEKQLGMVQAAAKHLLSLINDLLDLARIDSGNVTLRAEPVACAALVDEVVQTLRPAAWAKGLRLETGAAADDAAVVLNTDRRALQQILINLVNNAIKFTERGSVTVAIDAGDADEIRLHVIDTGVGIAAADLERLFQAFTQVGERSGRTAQEGAGLGLHLSDRLARLLGGHIAVASEPGRGSRFTLVLPR